MTVSSVTTIPMIFVLFMIIFMSYHLGAPVIGGRAISVFGRSSYFDSEGKGPGRGEPN